MTGFAGVGRIVMGATAPYGPRVWYRAETLGLADGAAVATWFDISGNDFHATQPVAGQRPTYRAGALNGKAVVEFDGVNDFLFHAVENVSNGVPPLWHCFVVFLTNDASQPQYIFNGDDQTGGPDRASQYLLVHVNLVTNPNPATGGSQVNSGQAVTSSAWHIGESWRSATEARCLLDGVGNAAAAVPTHDEALNGMYLGWHPADTGNSLDGRIAEIIGWERVLSPAEQAGILAYFATEYGV